MAKKEEKPAPPPPADEKKKKGLPIMTIGIVSAAMVIEAAAIMAVFSIIRPKQTHADITPAELLNHDGEKTVELKLVEDKFQNMQTGRVWLWDIGVYVQVKQKNQEHVEKRIKQRAAEFTDEINRIVSRAQHAQLKEPDRQTLNRQITAIVQRVLENDEKGEALFEKVLIPKCRGFPVE